MLALDTNVLVRFLVEDDEAQSAKAARIMARAKAHDERLFVSDVVCCELVWVLSGSYRVPRAEIVETLRQVVKAQHLAFASSDGLSRAVEAFAKGRGDFADYVIREHARSAGADNVATFDRALLKEPHFVSP